MLSSRLFNHASFKTARSQLWCSKPLSYCSKHVFTVQTIHHYTIMHYIGSCIHSCSLAEEKLSYFYSPILTSQVERSPVPLQNTVNKEELGHIERCEHYIQPGECCHLEIACWQYYTTKVSCSFNNTTSALYTLKVKCGAIL